MNLSYSSPRRSNQSNLRLLAAIIVLALFALAIMQVGTIFKAISVNLESAHTASAAINAVPQAVPVPTPSQSTWQHVVLQISPTPAPAVFQPTAEPIATPPAGK